jgi:hypothetical protein
MTSVDKDKREDVVDIQHASKKVSWLAPEMFLISYAVWRRHSSTYIVILVNLHFYFNID